MLETLTTPAAGFAEWTILLGGLAFGLRKLYMLWGRDGVQIAKAGAEKTIVEQLHEELVRLSAQRLLVADELLKLQLHINELIRQSGLLTQQVQLLTTENAALKAEIGQLREEVSRLKRITP